MCGSGLRLTSLRDKRQVRPHSPKRSRWRTGLCLLRGRIASLRAQGTRAWLLSGPQHLAGAEGAAPGGGGGRGGGLDPAVRPLHSRWLQCASGCSTSCDLRPPRGPSSEPPSLPASGLVPAPRFRLGLPHPALAVPTSSGSCSAGPAGIPFPLSSPLGRRPARPVPTRWPCRAPGHPGGHAVPDALALGPRFSSQPVRPCWPGVWSSDARWLSPGRPAARQLSKDGMASLGRPAGKPRGSLLQRCSPESSLPLRSSRDALPVCVGTWPCVARVPLSAPPGVRPGAGPVWLAPQRLGGRC